MERFEVRFITPQGVPNPKTANDIDGARFMRDAAQISLNSLPDPQIVRIVETPIPDNVPPRRFEALTPAELEKLDQALRFAFDPVGIEKVKAHLGIFIR